MTTDDERLAQIREMDEYEILDLLDRTADQRDRAEAERDEWAGRAGHAEAGEDMMRVRLDEALTLLADAQADPEGAISAAEWDRRMIALAKASS